MKVKQRRDAQSILPDVTPIKSASFSDPRELLTTKQQRDLDQALDRDAQTRRRTEASAASLRLGW
jgi:hypothetical protein